jgi:hypothetical protein
LLQAFELSAIALLQRAGAVVGAQAPQRVSHRLVLGQVRVSFGQLAVQVADLDDRQHQPQAKIGQLDQPPLDIRDREQFARLDRLFFQFADLLFDLAFLGIIRLRFRQGAPQ